MEYFSIMLKENSNDNQELLVKKLTEGFFVSQQYQVGKSLTLILQKSTSRQGIVLNETGTESRRINYTNIESIPF